MTIPADIREKAVEVRGKLCIDTECKVYPGCACFSVVADAIMAERERCAQIAERACDQHGFWDDGVEIASAIRNEGEQKT